MIESRREELQDLDLQLRFDVARQWALAARDVAQRSDVDLANEVWDFIENRTALGVPDVNGSIRYFFTEKPERQIEEFAFLAPVISKDSERLQTEDFRQAYAKGNAPFVAQYREGSRAIYFPEGVLTNTGKGIILLHEATHAKNDIEAKYNKEDPDSHWLEEADVYALEFDLLSGIGGAAYKELVEQAVEQVANNRHGKRVYMPKINETAAFYVWSKIFGTELTSKEASLWSGVAGMDAFWRYLKANVDNYREEFADYLRKVQPKP